MYKFLILSLVTLFNLPVLFAQDLVHGPHILVVMAHPDDESTFSVTLYKIVKEQHGTVDLFVITDGEAGFKYSTLAEQYYGVDLTDEKAGRKISPISGKKNYRMQVRSLVFPNTTFRINRMLTMV